MIEEMDANQAAEYLGLKTRQFRSYLAENLITYDMKVVNGKRKAMFTQDVLDEFKRNRAAGVRRTKAAEVIPPGEILSAPVERAVARIQPALPGIDDKDERKQADLLAVAFSKNVAIKDKRTLSVGEASRLFGVPEAMIRDAHRDGALRGRKIGRGLRFLPSDLDTFITGLFGG